MPIKDGFRSSSGKLPVVNARIHLRTTNPIESTFATVPLRQRVGKGPGSRAAGVAMAFRLIESAQAGGAL
jgi:hypothetical protein